MLRLAKDCTGCSFFNHIAFCHNTDAIRHLANDAEVMGDQKQRHVQTFLQFIQEFQNPGLDCHIECRCRFIGNQEVGFISQGHGDHNALALTAGQLMRIIAKPFRSQANQFQQFKRPFSGFGRSHPPVHIKYLSKLFFNIVQWIQRGHRFLENHAYAVTANFQHLLVVKTNHFLIVDKYGTGRM